MKTVQLTNPVYGALWAQSREGDRDENDILRRLLGLPVDNEPEPLFATSGFYDKRFQVRFREGFQIFRVYKGVSHFAVATGGRWQLNKDGYYGSLNELNVAIGAKSENAWATWHFNKDGKVTQINDLRDPELIRRKGEG